MNEKVRVVEGNEKEIENICGHLWNALGEYTDKHTCQSVDVFLGSISFLSMVCDVMEGQWPWCDINKTVIATLQNQDNPNPGLHKEREVH